MTLASLRLQLQTLCVLALWGLAACVSGNGAPPGVSPLLDDPAPTELVRAESPETPAPGSWRFVDAESRAPIADLEVTLGDAAIPTNADGVVPFAVSTLRTSVQIAEPVRIVDVQATDGLPLPPFTLRTPASTARLPARISFAPADWRGRSVEVGVVSGPLLELVFEASDPTLLRSFADVRLDWWSETDALRRFRFVDAKITDGRAFVPLFPFEGAEPAIVRSEREGGVRFDAAPAPRPLRIELEVQGARIVHLDLGEVSGESDVLRATVHLEAVGRHRPVQLVDDMGRALRLTGELRVHPLGTVERFVDGRALLDRDLLSSLQQMCQISTIGLFAPEDAGSGPARWVTSDSYRVRIGHFEAGTHLPEWRLVLGPSNP